MKISRSARFSKGVKIYYEDPAIITSALNVRCSFSMGAYSYFRKGVVHRLNSVGRFSSIGPGVTIGESEHPVDWLSTSPFQYGKGWQNKFQLPSDFSSGLQAEKREALLQQAPSAIGNDVWVGANVVISTGVHVGDGAVCAAGAVVNRDVPPYTIVGGVPAKPIRRRFPEQIIQRLVDIQWWQFDAADLAGLPFHDVSATLDELQVRIDGGLAPRPVNYQVHVPEQR